MPKKPFLHLIILFFYSHLTFAQTNLVSEDNILLKNIKMDVTFLSSDALQGRQTGTVFQDIAAQYIANRFEQIGLQPYGDNQSYFQSFYYNMPNDPHASKPKGLSDNDSVKILNVVGYINNNAKRTIIIGAHYDHLGMGDNGFSLSQETGVHNGADDNASGVAAILDIAQLLKNSQGNRYNYLFISFSGEEFGLWGSNYFTKHPLIDLKNVAAMINLDMVGRLKNDYSILIGGVGTSTIWTDLLEKSNVSHLKQTYDSSGTGPSDHTSFYFQNIPVLFYFTGQHEDYHKVTDDADKINFKGIQLITNNIYTLLRGLSDIDEIPFLKTKEEKDQKVELKVTLGIMPDYMFNGEGLRIDGVKEGRPADVAHLKQGDIIIQLGEQKVTDIQTYMKALNALKPGQKTSIIYKREDKKQEAQVQF